MLEHPLLFTTEMVKAVLDGQKTHTRRVPIERYRNWKVGDTIWAKEDYKYLIQGDIVIVYYKNSLNNDRVIYTPLNCLPEKTRMKLIKGKQGVWKSKLLMYKFMARIWLEITGLRVERVQDISENDAEAEGTDCDRTYSEDFENLWDSINYKRGYGWDKNPWVWVIEFKRKGQ